MIRRAGGKRNHEEGDLDLCRGLQVEKGMHHLRRSLGALHVNTRNLRASQKSDS